MSTRKDWQCLIAVLIEAEALPRVYPGNSNLAVELVAALLSKALDAKAPNATSSMAALSGVLDGGFILIRLDDIAPSLETVRRKLLAVFGAGATHIAWTDAREAARDGGGNIFFWRPYPDGAAAIDFNRIIREGLTRLNESIASLRAKLGRNDAGTNS